MSSTEQKPLPEYRVLGDKVESNIHHDGWDWKISTSKWKSRKIIRCHAQAGKIGKHTNSDGTVWETFTCGIMTDPSINLVDSDKGARATAKKLEEIHVAGLRQFMQMMENGLLPKKEEDK